jgi:anthranilate phosphoribosyltransferase
MKELLKKVVGGENLTRAEAADAMDMMLEGTASPVLVSSFLTALRMKGETVEEITGCAEMMKSKGGSVKLDNEDYIDFVGTGGDGTNTFNISTTSMFVCAAAGVTVAKHGNRASSSKSGAADLLEALGVEIMLEPEQVEKCIKEIGLGFMMAQKFHKAMKNVAPIRKELGIRTIFNMLGPLSNPSGATRQVIGVFDDETVPVFAQVMKKMGVKNALVVHGRDGMDEITTSTTTLVNEIKNGEIIEYELDPKDYGIAYANPTDLKGGEASDNAEITRKILAGEKGPQRDIVVLNSAAGIYVSGKAASIAEGVKIAEEMLDSGKAAKKLDELIAFTNNI